MELIKQQEVGPQEKVLETLKKQFEQRQSKYLVLGFCGAVGSDIPGIVTEVEKILKNNYDYEVHRVKISTLIKEYSEKLKIKEYDKEKLANPGMRYMVLQSAGNRLREKYGPDILAQLAIKTVSISRTEKIQVEKGQAVVAEDLKTSHRVAYLIDSLKHPAEIEILRTVYRNLFYLFGILCAYTVRRKRLHGEDINAPLIEEIMMRDREEEEEFGQKLIKTLQYADFFIRNNHENVAAIQKPLSRYFDLVLNTKIVTPTNDEYAMYMAQSAAAKSGCLSRQIGAVIVNEKGDIIATGTNDVPKAGGGLYSTEDGDNDMRCAFKKGGNCLSQQYKDSIKKQIQDILREMLNDRDDYKVLAANIGEAISKKTRLRDLIEFSRAVHAEMDALVSAARNGTESVKGATLYTTTFPCHNCARHIIAAGISKVYYIEPYEKSLAIDLHGDAIDLEPSTTGKVDNRVVFLHFEGVAPRQYLNLFRSKEERKLDGKVVVKDHKGSIPSLAEYLDSWVDFESKVVKHLDSLGVQ